MPPRADFLHGQRMNAMTCPELMRPFESRNTTMTVAVPCCPVQQPNPSDRGNTRVCRAWTSADPNCVVITGAGRVTCGMLTPKVSTNRTVISVTERLRDPALIDRSSTAVNGGNAGQNEGRTVCAKTVEGETLKNADAGSKASVVGPVAVTRASVSLHDVARNPPTTSAAITTSFCMGASR